MKKPFPPPFEKLKFDEDYGHYQVSLDHRGHKVTCCFLVDDEETLTHLLPHVLEFWKKRAGYFKAFREYAAVNLLQELNDTIACGQGGFRPATSAQVRKILPAPFSVRFGFNDDLDDFYFEMAGGEDETILHECVFSAYGTLENGIESGEVESML
jgi:hypothetical protein